MEDGNHMDGLGSKIPTQSDTDPTILKEVEDFLSAEEVTIVGAPVTITEIETEVPLAVQIHENRVAASNGQLLCKYATIAGAKDGGCERYGVAVCPDCQQPYCPDHASVIDNRHCSGCLSPKEAELPKEPLVDADGITHRGFKIVPGNSTIYKSLAHQIWEMTDQQLYEYIKEAQVKIKQAEVVKDYHMIARSTAMQEQAFREGEQRRKLRGQKMPAGVKGVVKAIGASTNGKASATGIDALKNMMDKMGIAQTPENVMKFTAFLASKKK